MKESLKKLVEYGADIEFVYKGKEYTILPWTDDGIVIGEKDGSDAVFETYEDMVEKYNLDGVPMKEVLDEICITFTSGC